MAGVARFEELEAWKRARSLTRRVYSISSEGRFSYDRGLSTQIQRAAVSVMSNIAEGFERYRLTEFHQFLSIAKGSCAELRSQLFVAKDLGYVDESSFASLMAEAEQVNRIVGALRASVRQEIGRANGPDPKKYLGESEVEYFPWLNPGLSTQDSGPIREALEDEAS